jgi:hypothetical protein
MELGPLREIFKSKRIIAATLLGTLSLASAQPSSSTNQRITIKLLNGKTGSPVWWRGLAGVRFGKTLAHRELDPIYKRTNLFGEAEVDVTDASPPQIAVSADFISRDCRYGPGSQSESPMYLIEEIRSKGIVSENYCGGPRRTPKPGLLMIYVIPSSVRELWNE